MILGTRGSLLATTQTGHVRDALAQHGIEAELHIVTTVGDVNMAPVERIGVGVFTQKLRDALARGECDIAVHSFKDLPTEPDPRFHLVVPERADVRDCLIANTTFAELPQGAKIGTGAPRRISQLKALRPDLTILPLRGNIDTRMSKVQSGELDAVVLAFAGLERVGRGAEATEVFDPAVFVPAPAQGALALECRADDVSAKTAIEAIVDAAAQAEAFAEREVLRILEAGCTAPIAAYAQAKGDTLELKARVTSLDGTQVLELDGTGSIHQPLELGQEIAQALIERGVRQLL